MWCVYIASVSNREHCCSRVRANAVVGMPLEFGKASILSVIKHLIEMMNSNNNCSVEPMKKETRIQENEMRYA